MQRIAEKIRAHGPDFLFQVRFPVAFGISLPTPQLAFFLPGKTSYGFRYFLTLATTSFPAAIDIDPFQKYNATKFQLHYTSSDQSICMSQQEKLLERLLSRPSDFTFDEAVKLLHGYGYVLCNKGTTSGSRVLFFREKDKHKIMLHRPHPKHTLKLYMINDLISALKEGGNI